MFLVRECSQENRNSGFLSDDVLWTCLCELFGADLGGLLCSGIPGGTFLDCGTIWDVTVEFSACTVPVAEVCLPVLSQEFCVVSLVSSVFLSLKSEWWVEGFFNYLGYCCGLG